MGITDILRRIGVCHIISLLIMGFLLIAISLYIATSVVLMYVYRVAPHLLKSIDEILAEYPSLKVWWYLAVFFHHAGFVIATIGTIMIPIVVTYRFASKCVPKGGGVEQKVEVPPSVELLNAKLAAYRSTLLLFLAVLILSVVAVASYFAGMYVRTLIYEEYYRTVLVKIYPQAVQKTLDEIVEEVPELDVLETVYSGCNDVLHLVLFGFALVIAQAVSIVMSYRKAVRTVQEKQRSR